MDLMISQQEKLLKHWQSVLEHSISSVDKAAIAETVNQISQGLAALYQARYWRDKDLREENNDHQN